MNSASALSKPPGEMGSFQPRTIGPYEILSTVATGGLSYVFLALRDGQPYALKCLKPERSQHPDAVESFVREVKIGLRLDHPSVVTVVDHGKCGDHLFYATPLLLGEELQQILAERRSIDTKVPLPLALYLIKECCNTLAYLHQTTVFEHSTSVLVHGDFSPDNILVLSDGSIRLIDFGSATQETWALSDRRHYGKLFYIPPELLGGESPTTHTDLYALSILTFYLLFGHRPFEAESIRLQKEMILRAPVPQLDASNIVTSENEGKALQVFFQRALHKDRKLRFQSVKEFEKNFFRVHFSKRAPGDLLDVQKYIPPSILARMKQRDSDWQKLIGRAKRRGVSREALAQEVESIVSGTLRRKHPRISIENKEYFVEVVDSRQRVLISGEIQELSVGGMLVRWKGRQAERGQEYGVILHLGEGEALIHGTARVLYEVQIQTRSYVGFQFTNMTPHDFRSLEMVVEDHQTVAKPKRGREEGETEKAVLRVSFQSKAELRDEYEKNMKNGGLFVEGSHDLVRGERVTVAIDLPASLRKVTVTGKVVFVTPKSEEKQGVALQLEGDLAKLKEVLLGSRR